MTTGSREDDESGERIWHEWKSLHLLPLVAISAVYLVIGVVGNATVCFVSVVRMRRSVLNNFVLVLALAELVGCMITIPIEITQTLYIYTFDYPRLCKFERYLRSFIVFFTSCLLIAIATERYQRIVKPHRRHVTSCQFWITICCSFVFSSVAALPEAVIAGTEVVRSDFGVGRMCSTYSSDAYKDTVYPTLWACLVVVIYVISTTAIGSIYSVIAVQIWKRGKLMTDKRSRPNTPDLTLKRRVDDLKTTGGGGDSNNDCDYSHHQHHHHHHHQTTNNKSQKDNVHYAHNVSSSPCRLGGRDSDDVHFRSRSHTGTLTRGEDPDEITPLPGRPDNARGGSSSSSQQHPHCVKSSREARGGSSSDDQDAIGNKVGHAPQNDDVISVVSDGAKTPKERNSLFSEILSYFQSKSSSSVSRNNSTCTEQSKFSFLEKRSSKEHRHSGTTTGTGSDQQKEGAKEDDDNNINNRKVGGEMNDKSSSDAAKQPNQQNEPKGQNSNQNQNQNQNQDVRKKFTAVFFDELAVTVDHRRRRATFSAYGREAASCDDLLSPHSLAHNTPLSLSPMGSVRSRGGYSRKRTTFIMFVMTLTTVLSLLPHVIVMLYRLHSPSVESRLSPDNSVFFRVAWNSFFISLAAHPYVYGFWNGRFKKALLSLFDDVRKESRRGLNRVRKASGFEFK